MADIEFACPACGETLEASDDMVGESVECPGCGKTIVVKAAAGGDRNGDAGDDDDDVEDADAPVGNACPECGSELDDGSVLCVACGFHTRLGRRIETDLS